MNIQRLQQISSARLASRRMHSPDGDDGGGRVAEWESMLDLFTLISFILIIAALFYVVSVPQPGSDIVSQVANNGSGVAEAIPQNELLLVIYKKGSMDMLAVLDGRSGKQRNINVTRSNITDSLNGLMTTIEQAARIDVALDNADGMVNSDLAISMLNWLAGHNLKFHYYTVGNSED